MMTNCKKKLYEYDVFLNHRGPDTKDQFLVPLIKKLKEAGIQRSFMDRDSVRHGENVFQVIEAACESARMHIAFFSRNYAQSAYCLKELHQMLLTGRPIITVFYDVLPEHVRRPRRKDGPYAEAIRMHEEREKQAQVVDCWVTALERAADLRGFVRAADKDDDEGLANCIVDEVVRLLRPTAITIPPRGGQYDWSSQYYELPKKGQGLIHFTAETHRNLHVAFSPKAGILYPSYEIVIGHQLSSAAQTTRSEIRRQEPPESTVCSSYPLNLDVLQNDEDGEYQFWICIDEDTQFIYVGRGEHPHEENAFIIFKDPSFLQSVQYFAFSSSQVAITYKNIKVERPPPSLLLGRQESSSSRMWSSIDSTRSRQDLSISREITFSTSVGEYNWSMACQLPIQGRGTVCFSVRPISTVHVAISPKPQTMDPMYEIVIGGWGNSECVLRRKVQGDNLCRVRTIDAIVKVGEVNQFWVSINTDTQLIHVGTGNQPTLTSILLVYKDPCFIIDSRYVSFLSWESDVVYSDVVVGCPSTRKLLVPRSVKLSPLRGKYEWDPNYKFSSGGQGILYFSVEARNDVMLAISPKRETVDPMYEIVIGGSRSGLRRCARGEFVCSVNHGLTNTEGLNHIWVSIDKETQLIQIGEQADLKSAFLMFKDPSFLFGAVYFAFSSWSTPVTYSAVSVSLQSATITKPIQYASSPSRIVPTFPQTQHATFRCNPSANLRLQDPDYVVKILQNCWGQYDWLPYFELPSMGRGEIYFTAEMDTDVHAAISPSPKTMNAMYEIVIGGWNNSKSVIRRASQGEVICSAESEENDPPIFPGPNQYWVSIDASTQLIKVGRGKESEIESSVLMIYKDANFLSDARYVAFSNWNAPAIYSNISLGTIRSEIESLSMAL